MIDPTECHDVAEHGRPVRLSVAVMAHPRRAELVEQLVAELDREPAVVWDERNDRWDTGRRSQLAYDPSATHHLVVQDDAVVPRDLCAGVERALGWVPPGSAMCLYLGRVRPFAQRIQRVVRGAASRRISWMVMADMHWGVGMVLPTGIIDRLVRDQDARSQILEYDRRVSRWLVEHRVPVWYPWPSLVDHRVGPSLLGHGDGRTAYRFLGADRSALDVDWSGGALEVPGARTAGQMQWPRTVSRRPQVELRQALRRPPGPRPVAQPAEPGA